MDVAAATGLVVAAVVKAFNCALDKPLSCLAVMPVSGGTVVFLSELVLVASSFTSAVSPSLDKEPICFDVNAAVPVSFAKVVTVVPERTADLRAAEIGEDRLQGDDRGTVERRRRNAADLSLGEIGAVRSDRIDLCAGEPAQLFGRNDSQVSGVEAGKFVRRQSGSRRETGESIR